MTGRDFTFSRNQRIAVAVAVWLLVGPLVIGFFLVAWWLGLILLAIAGWTTWDYIRKGDLAGHITEGISKTGLVAKGAEIVMTGDDHPDDGLN